ncbi:MAG: sulfur carrier protein ThiS [Gammaproteobacteria bacterium]|nr:sulfur carrier protein ThiS [Gammaproteobacteria bacterium]
MDIMINGKARAVENSCTVSYLINELGLADKRLAIEINREIVPRSAFEQHQLQQGDKVEIVGAIGGG